MFFVINPNSGAKQNANLQTLIQSYLENQPFCAEFYFLTGSNDAAAIEKRISKCSPQKVIVAGGDGTIKLMAEILKNTALPLGIIAAGSANGMAKELQIPTGLEEAMAVVLNGTVKSIDLIKVNEEICIHISDLGLNARLIKYFDQGKKRGMWGYAVAIVKALVSKRKMRVQIQANNQTVNCSAYMVAIANATKFGTGATINPEGNISDGLFEIVVVKKINFFEVLKSLFTSKSFHHKKIEVISTTNAQVLARKKTYLQVDGELLGKTLQINATILPAALRVLVPQGA